MSHGPSTFGTIITERRSPMPPTSVVMSSSARWRVEAVDARPERRVAEVDLAADLHEAVARGDLLSAAIASSRLPRFPNYSC